MTTAAGKGALCREIVGGRLPLSLMALVGGATMPASSWRASFRLPYQCHIEIAADMEGRSRVDVLAIDFLARSSALSP